MKGLFITGTGTNVGKTYITTGILEAWAREGISAAGYKPLCCGDRGDAHALLSRSDPSLDLTIDEVNPIWFKSPLAPYAASLIEGGTVDIPDLVAGAEKIATRCDRILIEGAGGWEVPLTKDLSIPHLAIALNLPILVVVDNQLGALNHTLLTIKAIQSTGLPIHGLVLNHTTDERDAASISNRTVLEDLCPVPILAEMLYDDEEIDIAF